MMRAALALPLLLAACSIDPGAPDLQDPPPLIISGGDPYADPGYPPVMGTVALTDGSLPEAVWTTYDFSVGAYDASAWFGRPGGGPVTLTITAYPDANPRAENGLVRLVVELPGVPTGPGPLPEGVMALIDGRDWNDPVASGPASVTLTGITREQAESGYGTISGTFTGGFCEEVGDLTECRDLTGRFDTRVQFDGL
jgi:hypothetical protein